MKPIFSLITALLLAPLAALLPAQGVPELSLRAAFVDHERHAIFQPGEPVRLALEVIGARDQADTLSWEIVTDSDESVATGEIEVSASEHPWRSMIVLPPGRAGYFAVRLRLKNANITVPRAGSRPAGFVTFGVLPPIETLPLKWIDDSRFGAQGTCFLESGRVGQGDPFRPLYSLLGWGWCYESYRMFERESKGPGTFKPETLPETLRARPSHVANAGLCPLIDLHGLPDWLSARPEGQPPGKEPHRGQFYPPNDWAAFERYIASAAAERAAVRQARFPRLRHNYYDLFWEPDWHWKGSDGDFIKMYEVARRAILSADPDGLLVGPNYGVLKKVNQLLRRLFEKGLGHHLDGITTHLYSVPGGGWPEDEGLPEQVRDLVAMKNQYLRPGAKIIQTEWGPYYAGRSVHTGDRLDILRKHMAKTLRAHLIALGEGIDCTWFFYTADAGVEDGHGVMFNLTAPDPGYGAISVSPKPTAIAIAACTRLLEGTKSLGPARFLAKDIMAYLFDRSGQRVLALWSADGKRRMIKVPTGVQKVTLYDTMGNRRDIGCADGLASVEVNDVPTYVAGMAAELYSTRTLAGNSVPRTLPGDQLPLAARKGKEVLHAFHRGESIPLKTAEGRVSIPRNLSPGTWLLAKGEAPWRAVTEGFVVEVTAPVGIENKPGAKDEVLLINRLATDVDGMLRYRVGGVTVPGAKLTLPRGETVSAQIPADVLARNTTDRPLEVEFEDAKGVISPGPVLRAFFPRALRTRHPMTGDGSLNDWLLEDFYTFDRPDDLREGAASWTGPEDLSFRIGFRHDEERLYIALKVRDQSHRQTEGDPRGFWRGDSVQIGLAARPLGNGWELSQKLTLAMRSTDGKTLLHRISQNSDLPGGQLDVATFGARVVRDGGETRYLMAIPWSEIDPLFKDKLAPSRLGVGVLVYDADDAPKARKVMEGFGKGMNASLPDDFGVLQLAK